MQSDKIKITWYGRCCFLIEIKSTKILIDPHDTFDKIDMGIVKADYVLISSTWHDHGHIGASPSAVVISEPSNYKLLNKITISGIETKENRGTRNVVFNIKWNEFSITNFADLGDLKFLTKLSKTGKQLLAKTNIAFARPNNVNGTKLTSINLALRSCSPKIVIPHHYYPPQFIGQLKGKLKTNATKTYQEFKKVFKELPFKIETVRGYTNQ